MGNNHLLIQDYYAANCSKLINYALKCQMSMDDAQDIVQDAFVRLLSSDKMINETTLPALVRSIVSNLIKDRWRHQAYIYQHERYIKLTSSQYEDGQSLLSMHETKLWLQKSMARLDEKSCKIYRMSMEEGKKVSEIADCLNIKYKTVENRLSMARKEVRHYMAAICL